MSIDNLEAALEARLARQEQHPDPQSLGEQRGEGFISPMIEKEQKQPESDHKRSDRS